MKKIVLLFLIAGPAFWSWYSGKLSLLQVTLSGAETQVIQGTFSGYDSGPAPTAVIDTDEGEVFVSIRPLVGYRNNYGKSMPDTGTLVSVAAAQYADGLVALNVEVLE